MNENDTYNDVIYVNEIYNLNFNSSLVILSACGTGKGKLLKGEGAYHYWKSVSVCRISGNDYEPVEDQ